jgi:hypothetical protein
MIKVEGKGGISATIIADSTTGIDGKRITTYELEYPRFIHSEFMTHRCFSRNAASSRAIPIEKTIEQVMTNPAAPIYWGLNKPGMQAKEEHEEPEDCLGYWKDIAYEVADLCQFMSQDLKLHKQIINRINEPFQFMKVVCTATEFENFFWLRSHEDAQPEIKELSDCMFKAREMSVPRTLLPEEWHTPYVSHMQGGSDELLYYIDDGHGGGIILSLEDALKVSASCCAQVSFRNSDTSLKKALKIYGMLVGSEPVHASPFEHQATPMEMPAIDCEGCVMFPEDGQTQLDMDDNYWSGNFKGWIQHRQLIPDNAKW